MVRYCSIFFGLLLMIGYNSIGQFIESSKTSGIDHIHLTALLMGGGATFFDYNSDGFLDLYITGGGLPDKLYQNFGDKNFYDVSKTTYVEQQTKNKLTSAVISGDINNDGCPDLFITTFDDSNNLLLLNNCEGYFEDVSEASGIIDSSTSTGATFLDINHDGFLDIYIVNYVKTSKFIKDENDVVIGFDHDCFPNFLYINNGDGTFLESAKEYAVDDLGCGLAVASTDIDEDGTMDLYVANDFGEWVEPNAAYINNYPLGNFSRLSSSAKLDVALYGMGIAVGDYDNNGHSDFYISNVGRNSLLRELDNSLYDDVTEIAGVANETNEENQRHTSWGTFFFDYDNDSDMDLFVSNGFIGTAPFLNSASIDPNKLFKNNGDGKFDDVSTVNNIASASYNRGAIYGDYDNDGDLDVFCVTIDGIESEDSHSLFYENILNNGNNWVEVLLEGTNVNRDAYGALVTIYTKGQAQIREVFGSGSFASQSSTTLHFGLLEESSLDSLKVRWDINNSKMYYDLPVNQKIYIKENATTFEIMGCMNDKNAYYNNQATYNAGCFINYKSGCMDPSASNYDMTAEFDNNQCQYISHIDVTQLGINEFNVFPNYFHDKLEVDFGDNFGTYEIRLYNLNGSEVYYRIIEDRSRFTINTSEMTAGLYVFDIVDVNNPTIREKRKLIKF